MAESIKRHWQAAVLLAVLALLPVGRLAELPILIGTIAGMILLLRGHIDLRLPLPRLGLLLFAGYWLPELLSAPDAINVRRAWTEVAADLRFLFFLQFAMHALRDGDARWRVSVGSAALLALFCLDGLLQAATGLSFGGPSDPQRLSGIFGAGNLKLGLVLGALSPLLLIPTQRRFGLRGLLLAGAALLVVVFLAGARAGWLMLALALLLALWTGRPAKRAALLTVAAAGLALLVAVAATWLSPRFEARIERSAAALSLDRDGLDHALSDRLPIWEAAIDMGADHPVNGVGVRGFREAYPIYAPSGDKWVSQGDTALHAHQLLLEIWAETGAIGLLCWLIAVVAAARHWRQLPHGQRTQALAPTQALMVMLFPLNTHLAFYSSFWGLLLFWLLALWLGFLQRDIAA
ncbi:MAG: O-antigen ligase family protein [Xanthomonadales bacterium]|nr:O-antigen ligase family protein [Xanthomonadales bacterium]